MRIFVKKKAAVFDDYNFKCDFVTYIVLCCWQKERSEMCTKYAGENEGNVKLLCSLL